MWYRGALLHAYYNFNVYFVKDFVIHTFWDNLFPKSEVLQIVQRYIIYYTLISILIFIFSKVVSFI